MNAQISFLVCLVFTLELIRLLTAQDGTYTLIHIPLKLYPTLLQPILRILIPESQSQSTEGPIDGLTSESQHIFLNISITPIECSIVCHSSWATNVFIPFLESLPPQQAESISVSTDTYMILSIINAGLDAAQRVMELSSPLALAGIPIFFITTYYSDFMLVPTKEREKVIEALSLKGFHLSENQNNFVNPSAYTYGHTPAQTNVSPPHTPPPFNESELQSRTFELLQKRNVTPFIDEGLQLVQCSGREISQLADPYMHRGSVSRKSSITGVDQFSWIEGVDPKLYTRIVSALVSQPRFLAVTLAQDDPPSLLLDKHLLPIFGDSIVGDTDAKLVPIFLDLVSLPFEVTGIVCGVAGRLVHEMQMTDGLELCYLSTARASAVILPEEQSIQARSILMPSNE